MEDYRFIRYFIDSDGAIWSGPHSPEDNMHYAKLDNDGQSRVLRSSYKPKFCVEISPREAARLLRLRSEGYSI